MVKIEFKKALEERLTNRLEKQTFDEITVGGSKLRFEMAMAVNGYPFELPKGANDADYTPLLSDDQYTSGEFDKAIDEVFSNALSHSQKDT